MQGVHPLARQTFKELQDKGIVLTPDDIITLNDLAKAGITKAIDTDPTILTMQYKEFNGLKIYPLTLGSKMWLQYVYTVISDPILAVTAPLYAACNAREPSNLPYTLKSINKSLKEFSKGLNVTEQEIADICGLTEINNAWEYDLLSIMKDLVKQIKVNPQELDLTKVQKVINGASKDMEAPTDALSLLMHVYGQPQSYWLWEVSDEFVVDAFINAQKILSKDEGKVVDPTSPEMVAFIKFKKKVKEIENAKQ